jgi:M6 family metalloprotease-like protein
MTRTRLFTGAALAVLLGTAVAQTAPDIAPPPRPVIKLPGYKTAAEAIRANPKEFKTEAPTTAAAAGYLGVVVGDKDGKPVIEAVAPDSPAEAAGLKEGDSVVKVSGKSVATADTVRDILRGSLAGDKIALSLVRSGKPVEISVTLTPATKPLNPLTAATGSGRAVIGITIGDAVRDGGVKLDAVTGGGAAEKAGVKAGDVVVKADGKNVNSPEEFREVLAGKSVGDRVELIVLRGQKKLELKPVMESEGRGGFGGRGGAGGWDDRIPRRWSSGTYKLAIIGIEYSDVKHNAQIKDGDWEESLFSIGTYNKKSATGQAVYGSMNDYYKELSYGTFKVEGNFVGWVEVSKKRNDYNNGVGGGNERKDKMLLLTETLDKYTAKKGKDALKDYNGVFFLFAGGPVQGISRGSLYWPHRANVQYGGRSLPYFIVSELSRGGGMMDISVFCHEFGHMIGLPDLYARPEQPGSEGVWQWCAMSNQQGGGRPQHFSAWCKEQLGWIKPVVIDPRVKQKLILSPIEDDPTQCFKVMVRSDGAEYFLLENRRKKGWDSNLPGEGLLIWRVVNGNRGQQPVYLEESHGIEGARGPSTRPDLVPFPSSSNNSFTPHTIPSSRGQLGGGLPVWITNIRKLPDGRIAFQIGYEFQ